METCINYTEKDKAYFSSDERKWINRIYSLKEKYPDVIEILSVPESNNGCIYATIPVSWLKIQPKRKYTEEQVKKMTAHLAKF